MLRDGIGREVHRLDILFVISLLCVDIKGNEFRVVVFVIVIVLVLVVVGIVVVEEEKRIWRIDHRVLQ